MLCRSCVREFPWLFMDFEDQARWQPARSGRPEGPGVAVVLIEFRATGYPVFIDWVAFDPLMIDVEVHKFVRPVDIVRRHR